MNNGYKVGDRVRIVANGEDAEIVRVDKLWSGRRMYWAQCVLGSGWFFDDELTPFTESTDESQLAGARTRG